MSWERPGPTKARPMPSALSLHAWGGPTFRRRLLLSEVSGYIGGVPERELDIAERKLLIGDVRSLMGMDRPTIASGEELLELRTELWGIEIREGTVWVNPHATVGATRLAANRIREVAAAGGAISFATGAPASLLSLYQGFAWLAHTEGAYVIEVPRSEVEMEGYPEDAQISFINGVAVLTRGLSMIPANDPRLGEELLFLHGKPDLFVGDGAFAAMMIHHGVPTVVLAPPTQPIFGVAHRRTGDVTVIPVALDRAASDYRPLMDAAIGLVDGPSRTEAAMKAGRSQPRRAPIDRWKLNVRPLK